MRRKSSMDEPKSSKGLVGLSSMLTDVQAIEQQAREQSVKKRDDNSQSNENIRAAQQKQIHHKTNEPNQPTTRFGCLGIIVFGFLLLFIFAAKGPSSTSSKPHQGNNNAANQSALSSINNPPPKTQSPQAEYLLRSIQQQSPEPQKDVITGYDDNHPYLNDNGLCEITIDNSKNDMPVYVRIWDMQQHKPVRAFYISQGGTFTADALTPGRYEIRYRELYESGEPSHGTKSQVYTMEQHRTPTGTQYDTLSLTLYKVRNGNARTTRIDAGDI